jgi:hypothetical protein
MLNVFLEEPHYLQINNSKYTTLQKLPRRQYVSQVKTEGAVPFNGINMAAKFLHPIVKLDMLLHITSPLQLSAEQ